MKFPLPRFSMLPEPSTRNPRSTFKRHTRKKRKWFENALSHSRPNDENPLRFGHLDHFKSLISQRDERSIAYLVVLLVLAF